jgi:hypothetical protein
MSAPAPIIIPAGLTVNIGRREYREGDTLPGNAPEGVKKKVVERIAELAKKAEKPTPPESGNAPSQGDGKK